MNLDFIACGGAPPARSPMLAAAAAAGATVAERAGWLVPVGFADPDAEARALTESVGFADASPLPAFERHGPHGLPFGAVTERGGATWCPLTPTRALVLGGRPDAGALDVTAQYAALRIDGPLSRAVMSRFCALDLRPQAAPAGSLRPGSVARTPGIVIVESETRLLVLVGAALAEYLWVTVADAAGRLGGGPVGTDRMPAGTAAEALLNA